MKRELRAVVGAMTLLGTLATPQHALASSVGLTGGNTGPVIRWPTASLDYQLHAACSDDLPPAACLDALRASFDAWVGFICSPITFTEGATTSTKNLTAVGGGTNGQNELAFIEDSAWTYGIYVLGVTAPVFLANGTIIESDIAFNGYLQTWSLDGADFSTDVINVAVHEIGHYFGAQHNLGGYDPADPPTMAPYADPFMESRTPESDDIRTLCFLYPTATYVCADDDDCPFIVADGPDGEFYAGQFTCQNNSCSDVSGTVVGGTGNLGDACVGTVDCSPGLFCVFTNGTSGVCTQDCTVSLGNCPGGFSCIPVSAGADEGVCLADTGGTTPNGDNCSTGTDCVSGLCIIEPGGQFCRQPCNVDGDCTNPEVCQPLGGGATVGACYPPVPGGTAPFGDPCTYGSDCASGLCVSDGTGSGGLCTDPCQSDGDCPSLYSCLPLFGGGAACIEDPPPTGQLGEPCTFNNDCISGLCAGEPTAGFFCVTPCTTDPDCGAGFFCAPLQGGGGACIELGDGEPLDPCQFTNDCQSNICISVNNGNPFCTITCAATSDCPCGMQCFNFDPDPLCIPAPPVQCLPNGDPCSDDSECVGLFCINGTCESGCATYNGCLVCDGFVGSDDSDGDGVPDACDNCLTVGNASQVDSDGDGAGDACDICALGPDGQDTDGDGVPDACETCFTEPPDPTACDDSNACTDDTCEPTGCVNTPNALACDDGDACTENDVCGGGACAGTALDCSDGNLCTDDVCTAGVCSNPNNTVPCDDGDPCTNVDACSGGACTGQPTTCTDFNPCTDDSCVGGNCQFVFNTDACDDGDDCTVGDACSNGVCLPTGPLDCSDGNDCTDDFCVSGSCTNPNTVDPCDDGDACTENDTCFGGSCSGSQLSCDDGDDCTDDSCSGGSCVSTPNTAACDDGDACTENDACLAGSCVGTALDCDDGVACTVDSCSNGNCFNVDPNCDDGDPCTLDLCDVNGCSNPPNTGACDDGDPCTENDSCATGTCAGTTIACDDGNPCTADSCVAGACTSTNTAGPCDDGNGCTENDTCSAGNCFGSAVDCDDNNPCTDDSCVAGACQNVANTAVCDDGDPCTNGDTCGGGSCAGLPVLCDDGDPCTSGTCVVGVCVFANTCPDAAPDAAPDAVSDGSGTGDGGAVLPPDAGPDADATSDAPPVIDIIAPDAGGGDAQVPDAGLDGAGSGDGQVSDLGDGQGSDVSAGDAQGDTDVAAVDVVSDAAADSGAAEPQPEPQPEAAPEPIIDGPGIPDVGGGGDFDFDVSVEAQVEYQQTLGSGGCDCQSGEDSPAGPLGAGLVLLWLVVNVMRRRR